MSIKSPRALLIDTNLKALSELVRPLAQKGFRIAARPSPEGAIDYIRRSRPDLVLLGARFWQEGLGREILAASPGTVVVPVPARPGAA